MFGSPVVHEFPPKFHQNLVEFRWILVEFRGKPVDNRAPKHCVFMQTWEIVQISPEFHHNFDEILWNFIKIWRNPGEICTFLIFACKHNDWERMSSTCSPKYHQNFTKIHQNSTKFDDILVKIRAETGSQTLCFQTKMRSCILFSSISSKFSWNFGKIPWRL